VATATVIFRAAAPILHSVTPLTEAQRGELLPNIVRVMLAASWRSKRDDGRRRPSITYSLRTVGISRGSSRGASLGAWRARRGSPPGSEAWPNAL
jgi:hypothetical protein